MNALIEKQNAEMLKLREDEQELENKREARFSRAAAEQKRKLEKDFGMERARAQMRIQKLSEYFLVYVVPTQMISRNSKSRTESKLDHCFLLKFVMIKSINQENEY